MKIKDVTPANRRCLAGACPAIFSKGNQTYLIVGRAIDLADLPEEMRGRIGIDECLVEIPADLLSDVLKK